MIQGGLQAIGSSKAEGFSTGAMDSEKELLCLSLSQKEKLGAMIANCRCKGNRSG